MRTQFRFGVIRCAVTTWLTGNNLSIFASFVAVGDDDVHRRHQAVGFGRVGVVVEVDPRGHASGLYRRRLGPHLVVALSVGGYHVASGHPA